MYTTTTTNEVKIEYTNYSSELNFVSHSFIIQTNFTEQLRIHPNAMRLIKDVVSRVFEVSHYDMDSRTRKQGVVGARFAAMYLMCKLLNKQVSLKHIGQNFGGRDHSSVIHAKQQSINRIQTEEPFRLKIATCIAILEKEIVG